MKKYKLSPWHDGSVKPVHKGVYEVGGEGGGTAYQYWNGKYFGLCCMSISAAFRNKAQKSHFQSDQWRGILKD